MLVRKFLVQIMQAGWYYIMVTVDCKNSRSRLYPFDSIVLASREWRIELVWGNCDLLRLWGLTSNYNGKSRKYGLETKLARSYILVVGLYFFTSSDVPT